MINITFDFWKNWTNKFGHKKLMVLNWASENSRPQQFEIKSLTLFFLISKLHPFWFYSRKGFPETTTTQMEMTKRREGRTKPLESISAPPCVPQTWNLTMNWSPELQVLSSNCSSALPPSQQHCFMAGCKILQVSLTVDYSKQQRRVSFPLKQCEPRRNSSGCWRQTSKPGVPKLWPTGHIQPT